MQQRPLLSSAKGSSTGAPGSTGGARKPLLRPRLTTTPTPPPSASSPLGSPAPLARLSPVQPTMSSATTTPLDPALSNSVKRAELAAACTPPVVHLVQESAAPVPSSNALARALLKRAVPLPIVSQPLHPSPLPPLPASAAGDEAAGKERCIAGRSPAHGCDNITPDSNANTPCEAHDARHTACAAKRDRQLRSAGSHSTASSSATMPVDKRRTADLASTSLLSVGGITTLTATTTTTRDAKASAFVEFNSREVSSGGEESTTEAAFPNCFGLRGGAPSALSVADVARVAGSTPSMFYSTFAQDDDEEEEGAEDLALAVSPMQRARVLTDELLRDWTGCEDLDLVLSFEFRLDAEKMMGIYELGQRLPNLQALRVSRSYIPRVRLLGTRYVHLQHLWINNCKLEDIRGIGTFAPNLTELYASFNTLKDLTPLLDLSETLEVLDVEGNQLNDVAALAFVLPMLHKVTSLNVSGNGVMFKAGEVERALADLKADLGITTFAVTGENAEDAVAASLLCDAGAPTSLSRGVAAFREWVQLLMPQLEMLDDIPTGTLTESDEEDVSVGGNNEEADGDHQATLSQGRPHTASNTRPTTQHGALRAAHVYVDPLDEALSAELRLLQDCIRENESYQDRLTDSMERKHSGLYARPTTACAAGARQRIGSRLGSASVTGSRCPTSVSVSASSASLRPVTRLPSAGPTDGAVSDLTTGSVLAGSAISSLRRRLHTQQQQQQQPPLNALESAVATASSLPPAGRRKIHSATQQDRENGSNTGEDEDDAFPGAASPAMAGATGTSNVARNRLGAAGSAGNRNKDDRSERPLISDSDGEDDDADLESISWERYKANLVRRLTAPSLAASASAAVLQNTDNAKNTPQPMYRALYQQFFPEEAAQATQRAQAKQSPPQAKAASNTRDSSTSSVSEVDLLVRKEVSRTRAQLAVLAAAEEAVEGAATGESAWAADAFMQGSAATVPTVRLHQPDVLELSEE